MGRGTLLDKHNYWNVEQTFRTLVIPGTLTATGSIIFDSADSLSFPNDVSVRNIFAKTVDGITLKTLGGVEALKVLDTGNVAAQSLRSDNPFGNLAGTSFFHTAKVETDATGVNVILGNSQYSNALGAGIVATMQFDITVSAVGAFTALPTAGGFGTSHDLTTQAGVDTLTAVLTNVTGGQLLLLTANSADWADATAKADTPLTDIVWTRKLGKLFSVLKGTSKTGGLYLGGFMHTATSPSFEFFEETLPAIRQVFFLGQGMVTPFHASSSILQNPVSGVPTLIMDEDGNALFRGNQGEAPDNTYALEVRGALTATTFVGATFEGLSDVGVVLGDNADYGIKIAGDGNSVVAFDIDSTYDAAGSAGTVQGNLDTHTGDVTLHRTINDAGAASTDLWSANKINTQKMDAVDRGATNGVAPLVSDKIPSSYLPSLALTDVFTPADLAARLALSTAELGDLAIQTDTGLSYILADPDYSVDGSWVPVNSPNDGVASVNGDTGPAVTLTTADINEVTNLYYTEGRVDGNSNVAANSAHTALTASNPHGTTTAQISEVTNLYFTNARADGRVAAHSDVTTAKAHADISDGSNPHGTTTANISEDTNLYYTEARVNANANVSANTTHRGTTGNPHSATTSDITEGTNEYHTTARAQGVIDGNIAAGKLVAGNAGKILQINGAGSLYDITSFKMPTGNGTADQVLTTAGDGTTSWEDASGGGGSDFVSLSDTPANFTSGKFKKVRVNAGATALEFATDHVITAVTDITGEVGDPIEYAVTDLHHTIIAGKAAATTNVNFTVANLEEGQVIIVKNVSITGTVNLVPSTGTIDGEASIPIAVYETKILQVAGGILQVIDPLGPTRISQYAKLAASNTWGANQIYADNVYQYFGTSSDMFLCHNGSHSYVKNTTGILYLTSTNNEVVLSGNNVIGYRFGSTDGSRINHKDASEHFRTTDAGVKVTGDLEVTTSATVGLALTVTGKVNANAGVALGNTADTTAGNIRYDGSDFTGRVGGEWKSFTTDSSTPITDGINFTALNPTGYVARVYSTVIATTYASINPPEVWIAGGQDTNQVFQVLSSTDGVTFSEKTLTFSGDGDPSSISAGGYQLVNAGDYVCLFYSSGGETKFRYTLDGETWVYNTSTNPPGLVSVRVVYFLGVLWVIGMDGSTLEIWKGSIGQNFVQQSLSNPFSSSTGTAVTSFNGKIWVTGGWVSGYSDEVWSSVDGTTWVQESGSGTGNASFTPRINHTLTIYSNKMYVIGGNNASTTFDDVWVSEDGITWREAYSYDQEIVSRTGHGAAVFNGEIHIYAGLDSASNYLSDGWKSVLDPNVLPSVRAASYLAVGDFAGTPQKGMIKFDGTNFKGYTGTSWVTLG